MACTQCYKLFWIPTAWDLTNLERYYFEGTTLGSRAMDEPRHGFHSLQQAGAGLRLISMIGRGMQWDRKS